MNKQTLEVYRLLILRKSTELIDLAYSDDAAEEFLKTFDEIQNLKETFDKLEQECA